MAVRIMLDGPGRGMGPRLGAMAPRAAGLTWNRAGQGGVGVEAAGPERQEKTRLERDR